MKESEDMRIEPVDGAPISLKKVSDHLTATADTKNKSNTYVLVNNMGIGYVNDDPHMANITIREREIQADYFLSLNLPMPTYLRPYLEYMYEDDGQDIDALYKYASSNDELKQIIGLIQLFGGSLNMARKAKKGVKLYVEEPETRMHPKRERRVMGLLEKIKKDYGFKEEENGKEGE